MNRPKRPEDERVLDLLVERATGGLSEQGEQELARLAGHEPEWADDVALAAAAADLAFAEEQNVVPDPMPEHLRRRIQAAGERYIEGGNPAADPSRPRASRWIDSRAAGWYAAAAMLLLAVLLQIRSPEPPTGVTAPDLSAQRQQLLDSAFDVLRVAWNPPDDPRFATVEGDVVWSNARQTGFLRLRGMPANRAETEQYQLWIVDPQRDRNPVDGGVFDVSGTADEVLIPIHAKLEVVDPAAFAITLEQPGGVVVSDGPLLVVAAVEG